MSRLVPGSSDRASQANPLATIWTESVNRARRLILHDEAMVDRSSRGSCFEQKSRKGQLWPSHDFACKPCTQAASPVREEPGPARPALDPRRHCVLLCKLQKSSLSFIWSCHALWMPTPVHHPAQNAILKICRDNDSLKDESLSRWQPQAQIGRGSGPP